MGLGFGVYAAAFVLSECCSGGLLGVWCRVSGSDFEVGGLRFCYPEKKHGGDYLRQACNTIKTHTTHRTPLIIALIRGNSCKAPYALEINLSPGFIFVAILTSPKP